MAVHGIRPQHAIPIQRISVEPQPEIIATTSGIFENIKPSLLYWWNLCLSGTKLAFANTGFFFFRALEFISPTLALRAEGIVLRISNAWQGMQHDRAVDGLLQENAELQWHVRDLTQKSQDRDQLAVECGDLREQNQFLQGQQQGAQGVNQEQAQQVQAVGAQRDLVFQDNARLTLEVQRYEQQLQALRAQVQPLTQRAQQLELELRDTTRAAQDYVQQIEPTQALYGQIQQIAESCAQVLVSEPTQLDDQLERLLPLLLNQIGQAQQLLAEAKEDLDPQGSAIIAVGSFERIIPQIQQVLANIPVAFRRHSAWQSNIHQLTRAKGQEAY